MFSTHFGEREISPNLAVLVVWQVPCEEVEKVKDAKEPIAISIYSFSIGLSAFLFVDTLQGNIGVKKAKKTIFLSFYGILFEGNRDFTKSLACSYTIIPEEREAKRPSQSCHSDCDFKRE